MDVFSLNGELLKQYTRFARSFTQIRSSEIQAKVDQLLHASAERDFDTVFAALAQLRAGGLVIGADPLLNARPDQLVALGARHAVPTIYQYREFVEAGGLISYGGNLSDQYRLVGGYTGRIITGKKPADLPAQQLMNVGELVINLKTAKALGLEVPMSLLMRVNEVIE
jgi:putative tryptophan/tyrosine transport system substrate-binding protein